MNAADIIARALVPGAEPVPYQHDLARAALAALEAAGYVVLAPQDIEWGQCTGEGAEPGDPHRVSLSLCAGCLEYDPE